MKLIKATIAAAAALACGLPAAANQMTSSEEYAFSYGFASAAVMNICMNYKFNEIDTQSFVSRIRSVQNLDGVTPGMWSVVVNNQSAVQGCGPALNRYGFTNRIY